MATLQNFPQALIDEHMAWHMNPIGTPGARSATNQGQDFLNFHHQFLQKVFQWFGTQSAEYQSQYDLSPSWAAIPMELKTDPATGWDSLFASEEQRITTFLPAFSGENEFGSFIELGIHNNYLHGACAIHYHDPNIGSPMTAPVISTWFYKIHGLVDRWWAAYRGHFETQQLNHRFSSAVRILFGVVNDGPGVVIGPDGHPDPVGPFGPLTSTTSHEMKQAVIGMAMHHLSSAITDGAMRSTAQKVSNTLIQRSLQSP
jgi:hypothetical protein